MTRINLVDPALLPDQFLMAEYRELPMVMGSLRRTLNSKAGWQASKVSPTYTLNKGHVYFFTNKRAFLRDRFEKLIHELRKRNFNIDPSSRNVDWSVFDNVPQVEWHPTPAEVVINAERLRIRYQAKPLWYKYFGGALPRVLLKFYDPDTNKRILEILDSDRNISTPLRNWINEGNTILRTKIKGDGYEALVRGGWSSKYEYVEFRNKEDLTIFLLKYS